MITKQIKNNDGSIETIEISSNDNYELNMNKKYKIANNYTKESKLKNSILGFEIGVKNNLFINLLLTSLVIVLISTVIMFYNYRIY